MLKIVLFVSMAVVCYGQQVNSPVEQQVLDLTSRVEALEAKMTSMETGTFLID